MKLWRYLRKGRYVPTAMLSLAILKIGLFRGYREHLLSTWMAPDRRSMLDRVLYGIFFTMWLQFDYYGEKDPEVREQRKSLAMGGDNGRAWAADYESRSIKD